LLALAAEADMKRRTALAGSLAALAAPLPAHAAMQVDLQLVLAVDVSRSVDEVAHVSKMLDAYSGAMPLRGRPSRGCEAVN